MRYKIVQGSESGHCCFAYTIMDTNNPEDEQLCECFYEEQATLICNALNAMETKEKI